MLYIGSDHGGYRMKEAIKDYLDRKGASYQDLGNERFDLRDDYPDYADPVAKMVSKNNAHRGLLFCGNAQGVCIVANKVRDIRAGIGYSTYAARSARQEDDINILCLPGRAITLRRAKRIVNAFLATRFSKKERYVRRIGKIRKIERAR